MRISSSIKSPIIKLSLLVSVLTLMVYIPAVFCGFVNFDDPEYIYKNPAIKDLDGQFILDAFSASYMGLWMPLTWISLAIDYHFWGLNPFGYHFTNILLHSVNAGGVVLVADRLYMGWRGVDTKPDRLKYSFILLLAGICWSLHPLRVESVAWVTERKDVLNGFFSIASIHCYLGYAIRRRGGGADMGSKRGYFYSLGLFLLSLMAKPVSVVLPLMFLVMDWYPLRHLRRDNFIPLIKEKAPFFFLAVLMIVATIKLAAGKSITILAPLSELSVESRFLVAGHGLIEYVRMIIWPSGLTHLYMIPRVFPLSFYVYPVIAIVFTCCCIKFRIKYPFLLACWLLFILPLMPVLGFLQSGAQSHADRFTYLPAILPGIIVVYLLAAATDRNTLNLSRTSVYAGALIIPILYIVLTIHQIGFWKDSETLWSRLISIQPIGRAYYYRGDYRLQQMRYDEAVADLRESIRMGYEAGHSEMSAQHAICGEALRLGGRFEESLDEFSLALAFNPKSQPEVYYNRSRALLALGRKAEADADLSQAKMFGLKGVP